MVFCIFFFVFNDTATTEIYTLSLHDALPILGVEDRKDGVTAIQDVGGVVWLTGFEDATEDRSEEHTSELQSRQYLVCRLLLEKKKKETTELKIPCITYRHAKI